MSTINVLVFAIFTLLFYKLVDWYIKKAEFHKKIDYWPGPKALPLIGSILETKSCADLLPFLMKNQNTYGTTFRLQLGTDPYIFTSDPNLMEAITSSSTQIEKTKSYHFMKNWLGDGLLSASNPRWHSHRRMITPAFHFKILRDFLPIFNKNAWNLVDHWKNTTHGKPKRIDVFEDILPCTLDIICETAMGTRVNALRDGKSSKYIESIKSMGRTVAERTFSVWMRSDVLYRFSQCYKNEIQSLQEIKKTSNDVIQSKRRELQANIATLQCKNVDDDVGIKKRMAFLDLMMAAEKEGGGVMTDEELNEEVNTLIFAGHDTTGTTISFALYYIATYPEVQQRVYEEVCSIPDSDVSYEQLSDLKYLEMVIKETMRIMPTVPLFYRKLTDDVIYDGHKFPKGLNMACFVFGAHRNPELFEEPEKFIPERFTLENCCKRHAFAYIPFSAGPRNCIGSRYALVEMKALIAVLVRNFKFSRASGVDIKPIAEAVMKSENGVQLIVEERK